MAIVLNREQFDNVFALIRNSEVRFSNASVYIDRLYSVISGILKSKPRKAPEGELEFVSWVCGILRGSVDSAALDNLLHTYSVLAGHQRRLANAESEFDRNDRRKRETEAASLRRLLDHGYGDEEFQSVIRARLEQLQD